MIYVVHDENNAPIISGSRTRRYANGSTRSPAKRQPKAYTSERNARIAISNMSGGVIVPYVPRAEVVAMYETVRKLFMGDVPDVAEAESILKRCGLALDGDMFVTEEVAEAGEN